MRISFLVLPISPTISLSLSRAQWVCRILSSIYELLEIIGTLDSNLYLMSSTTAGILCQNCRKAHINPRATHFIESVILSSNNILLYKNYLILAKAHNNIRCRLPHASAVTIHTKSGNLRADISCCRPSRCLCRQFHESALMECSDAIG